MPISYNVCPVGKKTAVIQKNNKKRGFFRGKLLQSRTDYAIIPALSLNNFGLLINKRE